jgi:ABC-type antimicrobial peptide transport system permease subunit
MEKILRLALANMRKHRIETVSLAVLVMLCMLLAGASISGSISIKTIFPHLMEQTGSYDNYFLIEEKVYDKEYEEILRKDSRVKEFAVSELLFSEGGNYINAEGKQQGLFMSFITADNEAKLRQGENDFTLTDADLEGDDHPIWMPFMAKYSLNLHPGDTFTIVYGSRKFNFTIAGFYETMFMENSGGGVKMIVSENDYRTLATVNNCYKAIAFNDDHGAGGDQMLTDLLDAFENYSGKDIASGASIWQYEGLRMNVDVPVEILLRLLLAMAGVIILSVLLMIRFRITGDIKEQIVSIGVLEALGYTSKEITLSYVIEYLLIAGAGILPGFAGCYLLTPLLCRIGSFMAGHDSSARTLTLPLLLTAAAILLLVAAIAFIRARMVRNYPPVRAFRKGQGDHRFGRDHFPLSGTKSNVHIRLAMKGFLANFMQSLGLTVCISVSVAASIACFVLFSLFGSDYRAIERSAGMEISDLRILVMPYTDAEALAEELVTLPEIRKATPTTGFTTYVSMVDHNAYLLPSTFSDFSLTENIFPMKGRFPEHDNEIMLTNTACRAEKLDCGDTVTLEYLNVKRQYLITGVVTSMTNGGANLYITHDGMKRLNPNFRPDTIEVYLEEGVDSEAFRDVLTARYGRSIADAAEEESAGGDTASRIRAEAERQMAELLASGATTHVEYAIRYGDELITGNSDQFRIKSVTNLHDILETQLHSYSVAIAAITAVFIVLSSVVVMIILLILMESSVRKQRRELGIMKGMGYTSRELMFQLAARIMPASVFAVAAGTGCGIALTSLFTSIFGKVNVNIPAVLLLDLLILAFCFLCAYTGARKIRTISVCELMTE